MQIQISDLSVRYEVAGSGKPLVFLHGWGGKWESWYPVFYPLSNKFKVIALDLPGFGESEMPKNPWDLSQYAEFIKEFIECLSLKGVTIIGHSFGGAIAIKYFSSSVCSNKRVERLVLVDASGIRAEKSPKVSLLIKTAKCVKNLPIPQTVKTFLFDKFASEDYKQVSSSQAQNKTAGRLRDIYKKVVNEDLASEISNIKVSTLIIWGEKDPDTPLSEAKVLNKKIKNSTLKILLNCGHFSYLEKPEEFCELVEDFVNAKA